MSNPHIDYRLKRLSHSSRQTLAKCKRKFQLYRLNSKEAEVEDGGEKAVTFAYGHSVGEGIQMILEGKTFEQTIWQMFLHWEVDLAMRDEKRKKDFWSACAGVKRFSEMRAQGFYKEYELVTHQGKPAVELSFCINFPDGFIYRGFVDAVLRHKITGEVLVLECKTTSSTTVNPAQFKNSGQAIGYSIVLDVLFPELSSYKVLYLVYQTKSLDWVPLPFTKSYLQRALWIQELLIDIDIIKMCSDVQVFPMNGDACYSFSRECEYLSLCTMSTALLTTPEPPEEEREEEVFQINVSLADLIDAQLAKAGSAPSGEELPAPQIAGIPDIEGVVEL